MWYNLLRRRLAEFRSLLSPVRVAEKGGRQIFASAHPSLLLKCGNGMDDYVAGTSLASSMFMQGDS